MKLFIFNFVNLEYRGKRLYLLFNKLVLGEMNGEKILIVLASLIIPVTLVIFIINFLFQVRVDIKVKNQTNKEISGLYITYDEIKSDVKIPTLKPGERYKFNISHGGNSNEDFDEAAMVLEYKDKKGNIHTEYIAGYIERGYSGFANIKITGFKENGKLKMDIKEFVY